MPGLRYVKAFGALIQSLDDFVAMARFTRPTAPISKVADRREGQFASHAEGSAAHVAAAHEAPAEVAKPATPMMPAKEMMQMMMHVISRYVLKRIVRYIYRTMVSSPSWQARKPMMLMKYGFEGVMDKGWWSRINA